MGNSIFRGIKWAVVGDSLTQILHQSRQNYQNWIQGATEIEVAFLGMGGTGWWQHAASDRFMSRLTDAAFEDEVAKLGDDTDIITFFGSCNDSSVADSTGWANLGAPNGYARACVDSDYAVGMSGSTPKYKYFVGKASNRTAYPMDEDTLEDGTFAGIVNETIAAYHAKCPNAKIVIVPGIYVMRNGYDYDKDRTGHYYNENDIEGYRFVKAVYDAWQESNRDGCRSWLSWESWYWLRDNWQAPNYPTLRNRTTDCTFYHDTEHLDENGESWDYRRVNPNIFTPILPTDEWPVPAEKIQAAFSFAAQNVSEFRASNITGASIAKDDTKFYDYQGMLLHPLPNYHQKYLAPRFANLICGTLGIDPVGLPESLKLNNINPPTVYTATFKADGVVVDTVEYEAGASVLPRVPAVPAKTGYTGEWEQYTLADADITINAIYTPNTYRVTFVADGVTVAVVPYQYGAQSITEPAVPPKAGYTGAWSPYTLGAQDSVSTAVYTPVEWEPTGYALDAAGNAVMSGLTADGSTVYEGISGEGLVIQFRRTKGSGNV